MELEQQLKQAQARATKALAASNFSNTDEGKLIQDYIDERVSYLLNKMTGNTPLDDRTYLSAHGGITELKNLNVMLQSNARQLNDAQEELNVLRQSSPRG